MEQPPISEIPHISRDQVIEALKPLSQRGISSPDALDLTDPQVLEANRILDTWTDQAQTEAKRIGTPEADLEFNLDRSTVFVDAGFEDPDYLDEVANDWLVQDLQAAEDAGLTTIASKIQAKMDEIEAKIPKSGADNITFQARPGSTYQPGEPFDVTDSTRDK